MTAEKATDFRSGEIGFIRRSLGGRIGFALAYPNLYRVGMSNLGIHILYKLLNGRDDTVCERVFWPGERAKGGETLKTLESGSPLNRFDLIGFAVSFEMDYWHILQMLSQGKVALVARERTDFDPVVIAGGPCATFNPEPLADFFDAFIIGEGEAIMPSFMETYGRCKSGGLRRREILSALAEVPGVYVPSLYEPHYDEAGLIAKITPTENAPPAVRRLWVRDLDAYPAHTEVVTDAAHFDLYLIETARGCGRHCRFCMAGYAFRPPRSRSLEALKPQIDASKRFGKRLGLMGAAISDHPKIDEICAYILSQGLTMSVASFRADSVTETLVNALAESGQKTLTMAPEAGSERMRAVINKRIEERHLFQTLELGLKAGIRNYRLYFMIGLPYETTADAEAIADLSVRLHEFMRERRGGKLTLSINPFVPKPFTPFQWQPMADKKAVNRALKIIRQRLKHLPQVEIIAESLKEAYVQAALARGDRRLGRVLLASGGAKDFWSALGECGLKADDYLYRLREPSEVFPWDIIDIGVSRDYLRSEAEKAEKLAATVPCFDGCRRCGVCD